MSTVGGTTTVSRKGTMGADAFMGNFAYLKQNVNNSMVHIDI
jgi:hypothetical protein